MPKERLRIIFILMAVFALIFSGCEKATSEPPSKPVATSVIDLPADDGTAVLVRWRHYNASTAIKYEILRGESKDDITTQIGEISAQLTLSTMDTLSDNNYSKENYYIILDKEQIPPTIIDIVKATSENLDSISKIGQKVENIEMGITPPDLDDKELVFASGDFYKVNPPQSLLETPQFLTLRNRKIAEDNTLLEKGDEDISVKFALSDREKKFIKGGKRILAPIGENAELIKKYGQSITSFVTADKRYCVSYNQMQAYDNDTSHAVVAGKEYFYKVVAYNRDDGTSESEILSVKPVDNEPNPVNLYSAQADKAQKAVVLKWQSSGDSDIKKLEIFKTSDDDTLLAEGKLLKTVDASWTQVKLENVETDSTTAFFIIASDATASSKSNLSTLEFAEFHSVELPPDLSVADHPNDDALALDIFWEPTHIALSYRVKSNSITKKEIDIDGEAYLLDGEIVQFDDDSTRNTNASPVLGFIKEIPSDDLSLIISYDILKNARSKASFAVINIEGNGLKERFYDKGELGKAVFDNIKPGEYTITAQLKNTNGFDLDNPEAKQELKINVTGEENYVPESSDKHYVLYRAMITDGKVPPIEDFEEYQILSADSREFIDRWPKDDDELYRELTSYDYAYFLRAVSNDGNIVDSKILGPISPKSNLFHTQKFIILIFLLLFIGISGYFLLQGRRGKKYYVRPIAGITHIDEALGRATEMGKPILYVMGLGTISMLPTLASMTILGRVAKKAAEYQNRLLVPAADPIVMLVAQETVRSSYLDAGRPDAYNEDDIYFVTRSQFSYAAAVSGIMMREKTATHFFMGWFAAESLILSEAGARAGAIQIAGTDAPAQLPFFITSCDYTLMGEELYAASAYMSKDPMQISALKIQDTLKAIYLLIMIIGSFAITFNVMWFVNFFKLVIDK